jgi:Xaa-Pro aminopeptidase
MFTRVLQGHIAVDSQVFPAETPGALLDSFSRQFLWAAGKNFLHGTVLSFCFSCWFKLPLVCKTSFVLVHFMCNGVCCAGCGWCWFPDCCMLCYVIIPVLAGTGHGVGAALNVHEGPQRISPLLTCHQGLLPGMIVSNEPGYYEEGNFGIRIENLLEVVERPDLGTFAGKAFLGFRRLTKVPFQLKLIDTNMLTQKEKSWINEYHAEVLRELYPQLRTERARGWLAQSTEPIP